MTKKILLSLLLLFCSTAFLFALAIVPNTQGCAINGYVGYQCFLNMSLDNTPLLEESGIWSFDLEDPAVQKVSGSSFINGTGLRIGSWSLVCNTNNLILKVSHDKLVHESDMSQSVDYLLAVECSNHPYNTTKTYQYGEVITALDGDVEIDLSAISNNSYFSITNYGLFIRLNESPLYIASLKGGVYYSSIHMEVLAP